MSSPAASGHRPRAGRDFALRLSITTACGSRCPYCRPRGFTRRSRPVQLTAPEITRAVRALVESGVTRVRLTGGEPLARADCVQIVGQLRRIAGLGEISLTTNGILLAKHAIAMRRAGLDRVNVHLDSLRPERFLGLHQVGSLSGVLAGLRAARAAGFASIKLNTVLMRGINSDEILDFCAFAHRERICVRFIELMNTGPAPQFVHAHTMSAREAERIVRERHRLAPRAAPNGSGPAQEYILDDGYAEIGFVASASAPSCGTCDRLRLSADGELRGCLFEREGRDLRSLLKERSIGLSAAIAAVLDGKGQRHPARHAFSMAEIGG